MSVWALASVALLSCSKSSDDPTVPAKPTRPTPTGPVIVEGHATLRKTGKAASESLADVDVFVHADVDGNGTAAPGEGQKTKTDAMGNYHVELDLKNKQQVMVTFRKAGAMPSHETITVVPHAHVQVHASMQEGQPLAVKGNRLELGSALTITGLPAGTIGTARVFNPIADRDAFPGDFTDDTGNMLVSAGFASAELRDASGAVVSKLAKPATLEFEIDPVSFSVIRDIQKGTDRIDVPLYSFNEESGEWVRDGEGFLVDGEGRILPESALSDIRSGKYTGRLLGRGEVTHFSFWNLDWVPAWASGNQIRGFLTIGGTTPTAPPAAPPKKPFSNWENKSLHVKDEPPPFGPASGAELWLFLYAPDGTELGSIHGSAEEDGSFEMPAPRSEAAGEDRDDNGITGEKIRIVLKVYFEGKAYVLADGLAPEGDKLTSTLGTLNLDDYLLTPTTCTINGLVVSPSGKPMAGAEISSFDYDYDSCLGSAAGTCVSEALSGADGTFSLKLPLLSSFAVTASLYDTDAAGSPREVAGIELVNECPKSPVTVKLTEGSILRQLTVTVAGTSISWAPKFKASFLTVTDAAGDVKWSVSVPEGSSAEFEGPVEYGTAPPGSVAVGSAAPLLADDVITVTGEEIDTLGFRVQGSSEAVPPAAGPGP